jgi:hypothetical protein
VDDATFSTPVLRLAPPVHLLEEFNPRKELDGFMNELRSTVVGFS